MRKKIVLILNKIYGVLMTASFFGGVIPLVPYIVALIIGGPTAEKICLFIYKEYYPWVIFAGTISLVVGLASMYIGKLEGLSIKNVTAKADDTQNEKK